jgi:CubicO group peptidase (beta-lactamase class C family)
MVAGNARLLRDLGEFDVLNKMLAASLLAATAWLSLVMPARSAAPAVTPAATSEAPALPAAPARREMTAQDVEAFLDGLMPLQIEQSDIAGAVVAVVKDGQVLFSKGYGNADFEKRVPVSPELTLFRTGSVTKLFTWTAVMQLVEQGKADLDADVNTYLDFKIPHTHGKPVTLRNLLTHRGGFQETLKNLGAQNKGTVDLGKYVRENIPDQIFAPGSTPSYSNYGASLAGYVVERISGVAFDQYVEDKIFKPLGMTQSTLRTPLPKAFEAHMSKGYVLASGGAKDFEVVNGYPAGSQSASALAMTRFMLAFLANGELDGQRILKAETVAQMLNTVTAYDPRQNGIALGFYEESRNGLRIVGHGGDTIYFHSDLHLVPGEKLGFFVSYNSAGKATTPPRSPLWAKFMDRYFPVGDTNALPAKEAVTGLTAADVAGSYLSSRRADTSLLRLLTELGQPTVTPRDDGSITVDAFTTLSGQPRVFHPAGDGLFLEKHGQGKLVFTQGEDGVMRMLSSAAGVQVFERAPPMRNAIFLLLGLGVSLGILLLNIVGIPVAALVRRHYGVDQEWETAPRLLRVATLIVSVAMLFFIGGTAGYLISIVSESPWSLDSSADASLAFMQKVGWVASAGVLLVAAHAYVAWISPERGFLGRLKETAVLISLVWLLWFAWTMNMFDAALKA